MFLWLSTCQLWPSVTVRTVSVSTRYFLDFKKYGPNRPTVNQLILNYISTKYFKSVFIISYKCFHLKIYIVTNIFTQPLILNAGISLLLSKHTHNKVYTRSICREIFQIFLLQDLKIFRMRLTCHLLDVSKSCT